jgi:hypothetical protein
MASELAIALDRQVHLQCVAVVGAQSGDLQKQIDDGGFCGTPTTPPCSTGVPFPGSLTLIGTGLLALAAIGRARKRSQK